MRRRALIAALILVAAPLHPARADSALGDTCANANQVYTDAESADYPGPVTFICNGSTLQSLTTVLANPTRYGIGTASPAAALDVAGAIRLSDTSQNCSHATDTGAIRYNSATFRLQSCHNGIGWTDVAAGATPAGSDQQVQLNSNGVFYASSGLTFNSSTGQLTVAASGGTAVAVSGSNTRTSGATYGVFGTSASAGAGTGVYGSETGASNTGYAVVAANSSATGWGVYSSGTSPNYFAGNVGIGTTSPAALLDVAGAIRLSDTGQNCNAGSNGALRFNSSTHVYQFCYSNAWSNLSGGGGGTPAGSNTQIQFNNSGAFGASANLVWTGSALTLTGDINYSGKLTDTSDRRAKEDIQPLPSGQLQKLMQLQPVSFVMKKDRKHRTELGLIAQDVEPLYPDLVETDASGMKSMSYVELIAPLIKAMQEQQAEIDELKAENERLEAGNRALAARLDATGYAVRYHYNQ